MGEKTIQDRIGVRIIELKGLLKTHPIRSYPGEKIRAEIRMFLCVKSGLNPGIIPTDGQWRIFRDLVEELAGKFPKGPLSLEGKLQRYIVIGTTNDFNANAT